MFGIDRNDFSIVFYCQLLDKLTSKHNSFLIGQGKVLSCFQCSCRRQQSPCTANAVYYHICLKFPDHLEKTGKSMSDIIDEMAGKHLQ